MSMMSVSEKQYVLFSRFLRRTMRVLPITTAMLTTSMLSGCGKSQPATLTGIVKFDGRPVAKGSVRLSPEDGTPGPGGLSPIEDGHYEISATDGLKAGKYLFMVYGFKETGRTIKVDEAAAPRPEEIQYIPRRYNDDSKESILLQPGDNTKNLDLTK